LLALLLLALLLSLCLLHNFIKLTKTFHILPRVLPQLLAISHYK
jgi:hypothetical protein